MPRQQTERPDVLAERYGRASGRSQNRSRGVAVVVAAAVVLLAVVAGWLAYQAMNQPVRASLRSWETPAQDVLPTTIEIHREPGVAVTCELVAVDLRRVVVGQLELDIPAGPDERVLVSADIPLEGDGVVPRLRGCHAQGE